MSFQSQICNLLVADVFEFLHLGVVSLLSQTAQSLCQLEETETLVTNQLINYYRTCTVGLELDLILEHRILAFY